MSDFTPKTRLEKILCGIPLTARSGLEKAVQNAITPYELTGTLNGETGAITLSDITAAELYAVAATGKLFKTTVDVGGGTTAVLCGSVLAQNISDTYYDFAMYDPNGAMMVTGHLAGTDAVVLAHVSAAAGDG